MKYTIEFFRVILISIEVLCCVIIGALYLWTPSAFEFVGLSVKSNDEALKWLPALPIALCGYSTHLAWKILNPSDDSNKDLHGWPEYWRLKLRTYVSLFFSGLAVFASVSIWLFATNLSGVHAGVLLIATIAVAVVNATCMLLAAFTIREITEK